MASINMKSKQLKILLHDFELMSKTALLQIQIVTKLTEDNSIQALYEEATSNEIILDRLDVKIREEVVFTVLQFNPIASDLRTIITYQDVTTNMERVGDMLLNIIHLLRETNIHLPDFAIAKKQMMQMLQYSHDILRNSIFSFSYQDTKVAYHVIKEDDKIDDLLRQIKISLQETFANKRLDKETIQAIININAIAHNIERIGDSATNIAEATIYLTEGKDIRHGDK